ncbi:hypothetical protein BDN72DRAFT_961286 [Pluteus cervinus]|uniref:Uncharacterized protein n=1 Tax=Pluteus cervinus TaxID=181527 RepID=A0ACD3ANE9_9AGAR|nr:hypothetical protein BDN72DRAFT_961286 [Pluteus cervinus]
MTPIQILSPIKPNVDAMPDGLTSPPGTIQPGILDLPVELLLKIMHDPYINLFLLAQTNRFLNSLVMNHYLPPVLPDPQHVENLWLVLSQDERFESVGINSKTHRADDSRVNIVAFLSIAFEIKTVGKLVCELADLYKPVSPIDTVKLFIQKFQRLTLFIRRLRKITDIEFSFNIPELLDEFGGIPNELLGEWTSSLDDLIGACTKTGCKTLHVSGGRFPRSWLEIGNASQPVFRRLVRRLTNSFWPTTLVAKSSESTAMTVRKLSWEIIQHFDSSTLSVILSSSGYPKVPANPHRWPSTPLATYIYNHPPHSDWPYPQFFLTTPLTNLTINVGHSILSADGWEEFLAWFHIPLQPTLTNLTIHNCNEPLPARPLVKFIHKLTKLEHLTILPPFPAFHSMDSHPIALPNLISVCAPSDFLLLFCSIGSGTGIPFGDLRSSNRPPKLASVQVIPTCQYGHGHAYDMVSCQSKVAEVLGGFSGVARVALDLRYCGPGDFDISSASYPNSTTTTPPTSNPSIAYPPPTRVYPPSYRHVKEIILSGSLMLFDLLSNDLMNLLKVFEGFEVLTIVDTGTVFWPAGQDWLTVMNGTDMFKTLKDKCRSVRMVRTERVDGEVRVRHLDL